MSEKIDNDPVDGFEYIDNWNNVKKALIISGIIAIVLTLIFRFSELDIWIENFFYDQNAPQPFIYADQEPWRFLYDQEGSFMISSLIISLFLIISGGVNPKKKHLARYGWFFFFATIFGTGILVNGLFKTYWGRPRPRETDIFGGDYPYFHILDPAFIYIIKNALPGQDIKDLLKNSSFSAGHPCEALMLLGFFFILLHPEVMVHYTKDQKPYTKYLVLLLSIIFLMLGVYGIIRLNEDYSKTPIRMSLIGMFVGIAFLYIFILLKSPYKKRITILNVGKYTMLAASFIIGLLMAIGRAVQFGHWPSDSLWTFIFIYSTNVISYYVVFRFPEYEKKLVEKWKSAIRDGKDVEMNNHRDLKEESEVLPEIDEVGCTPLYKGMIIFLTPIFLFASVLWIIEYSLNPDVFGIELIAAIVFIILSTILIIFLILRKQQETTGKIE